MIVRKLAIRASARKGAQDMQPKQSRVGLFLLLTLGAGAGAAIASLVGTSILLDLQGVAANVAQANRPPVIEARALFPPVPAVHKTVDVYDPAPAGGAPVASRPAAQPPAGERDGGGAPPPMPDPSPRPTRSPRPTPSPGPTPPHDN